MPINDSHEMANNQGDQRKSTPVLQIWLAAAVFLLVPMKNICQNESPNNKENLEFEGKKATFNDTSVFWHPTSKLPTLRTFRNCFKNL